MINQAGYKGTLESRLNGHNTGGIAGAKKAKKKLFDKYGVCWLVLFELPYWNPILFAVVDSMHAVYLGLSQSHSRRFWQINLDIEGGDGSIIKGDVATPQPNDQVLSCWLRIIHDTDADQLDDTLKDCETDTLWHICVNNDIRSGGT